MRDKFLAMTPELYRYMVEHGTRQDELLERVEREANALGAVAIMQVAPDQGALLTLLVRVLGARRAVEVGTFTGYSAICIARGLPPDGELVSCEINEEWAAAARRNLSAAGLEDRVDVRVGPALDTLGGLPESEELDFGFIDADKVSYAAYYEEVLARLRPGGLIVLDNVLLGGRVLEPEDEDESAVAVRRLNARLVADSRVDCAMVGVADGITLIRKR